MELAKTVVHCTGIRFSFVENGREIARAHLYFMNNNLHATPFGLLEDVFVEESARGSGIGSKLIMTGKKEAVASGCYKLIATSRHSRSTIHQLYKRLGLINYGLEFRMDL